LCTGEAALEDTVTVSRVYWQGSQFFHSSSRLFSIPCNYSTLSTFQIVPGIQMSSREPHLCVQWRRLFITGERGASRKWKIFYIS
jgi:hypothetical protein